MSGEARRRRLRALRAQTRLGRIELERLDAAFVHESAAAEHIEAARGLPSNQRLEFLGDAVLGCAVAAWLYRRYPDAPEGELALRKAYLVSEPALAETARHLGLGELLILGKGAAASDAARGDSTLADALEALIAVVYLERGMEAAARFVEDEHADRLGGRKPAAPDPKTALQELTQRVYHCIPSYEEVGEGPDHRRSYTATVAVAGDVLASGIGSSKKAAQRAAAAAALDVLGSSSARPKAP